jgi:hypothetical protein
MVVDVYWYGVAYRRKDKAGQGVGQCRGKFPLVTPLKTLRNKYDRTNKI